MYRSVKLKSETLDDILQIKENLEKEASEVTGTKVTITLSEVINKTVKAYKEKEVSDV